MKAIGISAIFGVILGLGLISIFEFQSRVSEVVIIAVCMAIASVLGSAVGRHFKPAATTDKPGETGNA